MHSLGDASEPGAGRGRVVHVRGTFGALWNCRRGPLWDMSETPFCVFREILYGRSWCGMMSPRKILGRSKVVWRVKQRFEETAKVWRLPAEFPIRMAIDAVL